jgi:hypothetical protein
MTNYLKHFDEELNREKKESLKNAQHGIIENVAGSV